LTSICCPSSLWGTQDSGYGWRKITSVLASNLHLSRSIPRDIESRDKALLSPGAMKMSVWRSAVLLGLLAMSSNSHAGGLVQGTVNQLIQRASDGLTYVVINGTASNRPACASAITG
jgi:hypothetical protein